MIVLLNSAVITAPGTYRARKITPHEVKEIINGSSYESYIGYQETAEYMSRVLGVEVAVNRAQYTPKPGDIMIVCRLKNRVANPALKGTLMPGDEDFEWLMVVYEG
ncbi:MAG: DUF1874 domain-containing protein [Thermofilum sp.]